MPYLDPAHVEAVADALDTAQDEHEQNYLNACARYLLTSTDPDVHAALLAALVRAGVLSEEEDESQVWRDGRVTEWHRTRRYVTRWEAVDE